VILGRVVLNQLVLHKQQLLVHHFYMAPELYSEDYDKKVDLYSFGLILYEIVVGKRVFSRTLTMPQL
jgi:serine/threonine protein kinase